MLHRSRTGRQQYYYLLYCVLCIHGNRRRAPRWHAGAPSHRCGDDAITASLPSPGVSEPPTIQVPGNKYGAPGETSDAQSPTEPAIASPRTHACLLRLRARRSYELIYSPLYTHTPSPLPRPGSAPGLSGSSSCVRLALAGPGRKDFPVNSPAPNRAGIL